MVYPKFRVIKEIIQPDSRGRISLGTEAKSKTYRVLTNDQGQIILEPLEEVLQMEEAARLLNVSQSYLNKLLKSGEIPSQKRDKCQIILRKDILAYKEARRVESEKILAELAAQAQELGLGY